MIDFSGERPILKAGLDGIRPKFMSGRMCVALAPHGGLSHIAYYSRTGALHGTAQFAADPISSFGKLFRFRLTVDGVAYYPEWRGAEIYPEGAVVECSAAGVRYRYELWVLDSAIVQRYAVLSNPERKIVAGQLWTHAHHQVRREGRVWRPVETTADGFRFGHDEGALAVTIRVGGDHPATVRDCNHGFLTVVDASPAASGMFFVSFNDERGAADIAADCDRSMAAARARYEAAPRVVCGDPVVSNLVGNAAPGVAALEVADTPGAVRASQDYWVWGWDSMVHCDALLLAHQPELVARMLDFYRTHADGKKGIYHAFELDLTSHITMAPTAQCIYIAALYNYIAATGDVDGQRANYNFSKKLLELTVASLDPATSLGLGVSLFPDYPQWLGENGKTDLAAFNNSLFYQALRGLAGLAARYGEPELAERCAALAIRVAGSFRRFLFDAKAGFWYDSADAVDGGPRKHYPLYAILWVTPFASELCAGVESAAARFMKRNFAYDKGLYMVPPSDPGFFCDGNQIGAYYPPVDRLYWSLAADVGRRGAFAEFRRIAGYYWKQLTFPEGHTHHAGNPEPTVDHPGCRQAFTEKAWICDFWTLAFGLSFDLFGITFGTHPQPGAAAENLTLSGKRIALTVLGHGVLRTIRLNGKNLPGSAKIAWSDLADDNRIELVLDNAAGFRLCRADGMGVRVVKAVPRTLTLELTAPTGGLATFESPIRPAAALDGAAVAVSWDRALRRGTVAVPPGAKSLILTHP